MSVELIDNFCNKDFASSKLSVVNPIEVLPELPFKFASTVGCSPITIPGAVNLA